MMEVARAAGVAPCAGALWVTEAATVGNSRKCLFSRVSLSFSSQSLVSAGVESLRPVSGGNQGLLKSADNTRDRRGAALSVSIRGDGGMAAVKEREEVRRVVQDFTTVMKFGGSSVATAHRMREVSDLILSFHHERPVIVLSAMGKTTNNLLRVCLRHVC